MDTSIHWTQTLNAYFVGIFFLVAFAIILGMIIERQKDLNNGSAALPISKIVVFSVILLTVPQIPLFMRASIDQSTGNYWKERIAYWQEEADFVSGSSLRPEFKEMVDYFEANANGDTGSMTDIGERLPRDLLQKPYLSIAEYHRFKRFIEQCHTSGDSEAFEDGFFKHYPVMVSEAKSYLTDTMELEDIEPLCKSAAPLIFMERASI